MRASSCEITAKVLKMVTFKQMKEFDMSNEYLTLYIERLEQFFVANGIGVAKLRKVTFLTVVGPATYALLRNLL